MAKAWHTPTLLLLFFFVVSSLSAEAALVGGGGRKVGGRTKIPDVKTNQEVQELGKYSVEEYNKGLRRKTNGGSAALVFAEVLEAEKQVVSGIKYYLKISAASTSSGLQRVFNAVVVVKPWAHSKALLSFSPSRPPTK